MTNKQEVLEQASELQRRRLIWLTFFDTTDLIEPDNFFKQLKKGGLIVNRGEVYQALSLLVEYGVAERSRDEETGMVYYRCR